MTREDAGQRYVDSEMAALELEQAETDRLASQLETQLRAVMKSGVFVVICYCQLLFTGLLSLLTYYKVGQIPKRDRDACS